MSTDALREEHASLQRAVESSRRSTAPAVSVFVREMQGVMDEYREARAAGLSQAEAVTGIEAALRERWPHQPSKFSAACDACDDTGWRGLTCWSEHRCGRVICARAHPSHEHRYVVACDCAKGDRHAGRAQTTRDDVATTMRTKPKKSGFSSWMGKR